MPASTGARLLVLGGTGEALELARRLAEAMPDLPVVTSLAGRTREPTLPPSETRIGGFGGTEGLVRYLRENAIALLVNATHPFAAGISAHAEAARRETGVPLLRLLRPAWRQQPGDSWIRMPDAAAAAEICRTRGKRIFISLGSGDLAPFAGIDAHFLVRMVDLPEGALPLRDCDVIAAKGPFTLADERRLIRERNIDLIVARNSGGDATYAKIESARELSIPVVMIDRPAIALNPGSDTVECVAAALDWIAARRAPVGA